MLRGEAGIDLPTGEGSNLENMRPKIPSYERERLEASLLEAFNLALIADELMVADHVLKAVESLSGTESEGRCVEAAYRMLAGIVQKARRDD